MRAHGTRSPRADPPARCRCCLASRSARRRRSDRRRRPDMRCRRRPVSSRNRCPGAPLSSPPGTGASGRGRPSARARRRPRTRVRCRRRDPSPSARSVPPTGPRSHATRAPIDDREATDLAVDHLALACVHAGADLDPELPDLPRRSCAQRIARAGPSKVAKNPSPAVSFSSPVQARARRERRHGVVRGALSTRGRRAIACLTVEPTMSVNSTVDRIVSSPAGARSTPMNRQIRSAFAANPRSRVRRPRIGSCSAFGIERGDVLHLLPRRSAAAVPSQEQAGDLHRTAGPSDVGLPPDTCRVPRAHVRRCRVSAGRSHGRRTRRRSGWSPTSRRPPRATACPYSARPTARVTARVSVRQVAPARRPKGSPGPMRSGRSGANQTRECTRSGSDGREHRVRARRPPRSRPSTTRSTPMVVEHERRSRYPGLEVGDRHVPAGADRCLGGRAGSACDAPTAPRSHDRCPGPPTGCRCCRRSRTPRRCRSGRRP